MTNQHPITPPPELVQLLRNEAPQGIRDAGVTRELFLITAAYRAGADAELEACCKWLPKLPPWSADDLRRHRRPKPPSLKEQALIALEEAAYMADDAPPQGICSDQIDVIRRALEALPE
jgi:hypothetical protein